MQLLTSWRDSLALCKPDNAKLFGLVTLNACLQAYRTLGRYFVPLLIGLIAAVISTGGRWSVLPVTVLLLYMFCVYLAARPSTLRKEVGYFLGYGLYFIWFSLFFMLWLALVCTVSLLGLPIWVRLLPVYAPLFPFFSITVAFLCDTDGSVTAALVSVYRGFLFVLYNLPICAMLSLVCIGLIKFVTLTLPFGGAVVVFVLLWPLVICTYINLYVKRVHEQFFLYFGTQE